MDAVFTIFFIALLVGPIVFFLPWLTKAIVFFGHIVMQIEVDGVKGTWAAFQRFNHYVNNPQELKTLVWVDGKWEYLKKR